MSLSQELYSDPFCVAQSSTKTGQDEPVGAASVLCPSANLHPLPLAAQTEGSVHFVSEKNINNEFFRRCSYASQEEEKKLFQSGQVKDLSYYGISWMWQPTKKNPHEIVLCPRRAVGRSRLFSRVYLQGVASIWVRVGIISFNFRRYCGS